MSDSKNEQRNPIDQLGEMLLNTIREAIGRQQVDVKLGDRVVITNMAHVSYLVPKGSPNTIGSNYEKHHEGLLSYFTEVPGIVTKINKNFVYNCGHCSREHTHDIVIYYKEINKSFYASSDAIRLVTE